MSDFITIDVEGCALFRTGRVKCNLYRIADLYENQFSSTQDPMIQLLPREEAESMILLFVPKGTLVGCFVGDDYLGWFDEDGLIEGANQAWADVFLEDIQECGADEEDDE